jgi:hypothetical protein
LIAGFTRLADADTMAQALSPGRTDQAIGLFAHDGGIAVCASQRHLARNEKAG